MSKTWAVPRWWVPRRWASSRWVSRKGTGGARRGIGPRGRSPTGREPEEWQTRRARLLWSVRRQKASRTKMAWATRGHWAGKGPYPMKERGWTRILWRCTPTRREPRAQHPDRHASRVGRVATPPATSAALWTPISVPFATCSRSAGTRATSGSLFGRRTALACPWRPLGRSHAAAQQTVRAAPSEGDSSGPAAAGVPRLSRTLPADGGTEPASGPRARSPAAP
jgi:hypothetical protein